MNTSRIRRDAQGFTLIELLCVIGIIALLASMLTPALQVARQKAQSAACFANLRQIGIAVNLYIGEHDNTYPYIQFDPKNPIDYGADVEVKTMLETLRPYGLTEDTMKCPTDIADPNLNYYGKMGAGSSYMWYPIKDGDSKTDTTIFRRRGAVSVPPSHIRQVTDGYTLIHNGHTNVLYADGHVRWY